VATFVDTHAHIQGPEFRDDIESVIERGEAAGVTTTVVPGVDAETSETAALLADRFPTAYFAAGFHPHEASRLDAIGVSRVRALLRHPKVVALGEIGLDYYRMHSSRQEQLRAFDTMLDLARESGLPVIVHSREADDDVERMLSSWALRARHHVERPMGVMHYFSGDPDMARRLTELGILISIHTSVTHPKRTLLRRVAFEVPLDALVIETDSPYGAPQKVRGKRNEPAYVVEAARQIAELKFVSLEEVARITSANAARLFRFSTIRAGAMTGVRG
jgi:TatD DNase family protein